MTSIKGFERVASAFDPIEVSLMVALLEGAGYVVLTPGLALHQTIPQNSFAFGPVPILVPVGDASNARALLQATQTEATNGPDACSEAPETKKSAPLENRSVWRKVLDILIFAIAGVSHPRDRVTIDQDPDDMATPADLGVQRSDPTADE
ncbi:hypothetical protein EKE94_18360 [Mesobaculum littorinae]|uniref:DUF2007 domain-containing protein n=1 Tax=Mesobaculum littorinae TaxID=2486419 RepID=A0A438ACU0_9RHOB|nr:hypothetical protein [Mesobaculum littorinae]RVV96500.1 hypothetical protein EKE94_18360 [Mesobaculum littorinae]